MRASIPQDPRTILSALATLGEAYCHFDADDRIITASPRLQELHPELADVLRPGVAFEELIDVGLARGHFVTDPYVPSDWRAGALAKRRKRSGGESTVQTSDGRWIMRRDTPCADGSLISVSTDVTSIQRQDNALAVATLNARRLLEDMQRTVDAMTMGVVVLDDELKAEVINKAFYDIWKVTPQDVHVGSPFRALMDINRHNGVYDVADADWETYVASRLDEIRAGPVEPREFRRADGLTMVYSVTELTGGKRLVSYFDITDQKLRETTLAQTLERSRLAESVINGVRDPIFVKDAGLNFVLVNSAFADLFGVDAAQMVGKSASHFLTPAEVARFEVSERMVLRSGSPYEIEEDYESQGALKSRMVRKARIRSASGADYVAGFLFDITDTKRRELEAEEARERLESVIESLPASVIIYDRNNHFVLGNRQMKETLPALVEHMQPGKHLRASIEAAHGANYFRNSGNAELDSLYDTDREAWIKGYMKRYEVPHAVHERLNPDGRWFKAVDTRTADGTFIGVRIDISEMKRREQELEQAQTRAVLADRAKSEFLANMSHEIRTPMNGVLGMAELLAKSTLDAKQKTFTDIIVKSGNALLTIINDILDFSKIDAGQLMLDPAPFNLAEAIEDVATLVSTRAKEKDLELIVRVQPGLPDIFVGDVGRIRQVVTNLVGNAVKFTDSGHVLVNVCGDDIGGATRFDIAVTDTGIGIPADKLDLIFEKFAQADASSTRRHEGTGLGLAITSRLIELMGGQIGVESVEGQGSTFRISVTLPHGAEQKPRRHAPVDVTGARVLVVDDNPVNRSILMEQMTSWSFDACAAHDGPEGLRVLEAVARHGLAVDCVILDYQMPGMTGADTARAIRANPVLAATPIIMLTSVDQSLSNKGYRDLDIDAHLIKPARSSALLDAIVTSIQRHRSRNAPPVEAPWVPAPTIVTQSVQAAQPPPVHAVVGRTGDGHVVDILVAEDNEVNQLVFTQILSETNYSFDIVGNGRLALEAFSARRPRMILMDVSMPGMNGLEATAAIRDREAGGTSRIPIVGVTAHALKGDRDRCIEAGMDDYLSKPISPNALLTKIELWMQRIESELRSTG